MKLFEVMREDSMQVYAAQSALQKEKKGSWCRDYFRYQGFQKDLAANPPTFRANGIYTLFTMPEPVILKGDLFAGSSLLLQPLAEQAALGGLAAAVQPFNNNELTH